MPHREWELALENIADVVNAAEINHAWTATATTTRPEYTWTTTATRPNLAWDTYVRRDLFDTYTDAVWDENPRFEVTFELDNDKDAIDEELDAESAELDSFLSEFERNDSND